MPTLHIAVLGGGYAGILAARRIAAGAGPRARVTLVTVSATFVERIRLHQVAAGQPIAARPIAALIGAASLRVARIRAIDVARRRIALDDGVLEADYVVNALGSAVVATTPGVAAHALRLDDPAAARAVGAAAAAAVRRGAPIAIVGGGLTAIELATELPDAHRGLAVALYCRGGLGDGALGADAIAHVRAALVRRGVAIHEGVEVASVEADAVIVDGRRVAVAATVWCAGFAASPLAAAAGLAVDRLGRMIVDDILAVPGVPWLYGAGDAAVPAGPVGAPLHMACKTAMPMAACAADNILAALRGDPPRAFRFGDSGVSPPSTSSATPPSSPPSPPSAPSPDSRAQRDQEPVRDARQFVVRGAALDLLDGLEPRDTGVVAIEIEDRDGANHAMTVVRGESGRRLQLAGIEAKEEEAIEGVLDDIGAQQRHVPLVALGAIACAADEEQVLPRADELVEILDRLRAKVIDLVLARGVQRKPVAVGAALLRHLRQRRPRHRVE